jgi:hypothetical protein
MLAQRINQAYLAHRLNHGEMVQLAEKLSLAEREQAPVDEVKALLDRYASPSHDESIPIDQQQFESALDYLGLNQQASQLRPDQPWSPYQRALYRRLAHPSHDPTPAGAKVSSFGQSDFSDESLRHFNYFDLDRNGALTPAELDNVLTLPNLSESAAANAVALRRYGPSIAKCYPDLRDGVTREDLSYFAKRGVPHDMATTLRIHRAYPAWTEAVAELPASVPLAAEKFDPSQVEQGRAGSCVLLSTLSHMDSDQVRKMFYHREDGRYQVLFADGSSEVVNDLTAAERVYHARTTDGGRWPGLLEVAMGQKLARQRPKEDGSVRSSSNGIRPDEAASALFGHAVEKVSLDDLSPEQAREMLLETTTGPKPWLCGSRWMTRGDESNISVEELANGISNNHAYRLSGYDPESDTVTLFNPWRKGEWVMAKDGANNGHFSMPFLDFYSSFRWVSRKISAPTASTPASQTQRSEG